MLDWFSAWLAGGDGSRSPWRDLRSGAAGWPLRLGLSLGSAGAVLAILTFFLGLVEVSSGRIDDGHVAIGLGVAAAAWCVILGWVWASYRRWRRVIRTALSVVAIWALAIPVTAFIDAAFAASEFLMASVLLASAALTILLIATIAYRRPGGRGLADRWGRVEVRCPECRYSMVGLDSCQCPECGAHYTIDILIGAQDYAGVPRMRSAAHDGDEPAETAGEEPATPPVSPQLAPPIAPG